MQRYLECPELEYGLAYWIEQRGITEVALRYLYHHRHANNYGMIQGWLLSFAQHHSLCFWDRVDQYFKDYGIDRCGTEIGYLLANARVGNLALKERLKAYGGGRVSTRKNP